MVDKRKVIVMMDNTSSSNVTLIKNIINTLKNYGYNCENYGVGPNKFGTFMWSGKTKNYTNTIVFWVCNGSDSGLFSSYTDYYMKTCGHKVYDNTITDGSDGYDKPHHAYFHGNGGFMHNNRNNLIVAGFFYGAADFYTTSGKYYNYLVRAHDDNYSPSCFKGMANPRKHLEDYDIPIVWAPEDYNGTGVAKKFHEVMEALQTDSKVISDSSEQEQKATNTDNKNKQITKKVIRKTYTKPEHHNVVTTKTDANGAFVKNYPFPYNGKYKVNYHYAGDESHVSSNRTIHVDVHNADTFNSKVLEIETTITYSDNSTTTTKTGDKGKHTDTITEVTTVIYQNGVATKTDTTYIDNSGIYGHDDTSVTTSAVNNISTPSVTTEKSTTDTDKKDPFSTNVPLINGNVNVAAMQHGNRTFKWADENTQYTITYDNYKGVMNRDSKIMQIKNYTMSKAIAVICENDAQNYIVFGRSTWNNVEETIYRHMVYLEGASGLSSTHYPSSIIVDIANQRTKIEGYWYGWKKRYSSYWFCGNAQNPIGGHYYTCGPTSLSNCTQYLHKFFTETETQSRVHATSGAGSSPDANARVARELGFTAEVVGTSRDRAVQHLLSGRPVIYHMVNHYFCLDTCSTDGSMVLVNNSSGTGILTGWRSKSSLPAPYGSMVLIGLNWAISQEEANQLNHYYNSMGGKFEDVPNTGEGIRKYNRGSRENQIA